MLLTIESSLHPKFSKLSARLDTFTNEIVGHCNEGYCIAYVEEELCAHQILIDSVSLKNALEKDGHLLL